MKMLDYQKLILKKVSFSKELLYKEIIKSYKWLNINEFNKLLTWALNNFGIKYSDILYSLSNKHSFNYKPNYNRVIQKDIFKKLN